MPNELNRKIKGTILKGHRHLSVKHGQQGIKSLMDRDRISRSSSFPKEKGFSRKRWLRVFTSKIMSSNRWAKGKASVLSYEVILLIGFQPSNGGCSWFPKIFGIFLISEESMPKKRLQREVCWGRSKKEIPAEVSPRGPVNAKAAGVYTLIPPQHFCSESHLLQIYFILFKQMFDACSFDQK